MKKISFSQAQANYDSLHDLPEWDDWQDPTPNKDAIIEKYITLAIKAMEEELDEEDRAKTTEKDITEWALEAAYQAGEIWKE